MSKEAENVWDCIKSYRNDTSKEISKLYSHDDKKIIKTLESYSGKAKYHGHQSGSTTQGTAPEATTNQTAAINYLKSHAPKDDEEEKKKGPDPEKKAASLAGKEELLKIIRDGTNLGTIKTELEKKNSGWESIKDVKHAYELKKAEKKAALKS